MAYAFTSISIWNNTSSFFSIQKEQADMLDLFGTVGMKQNGNGRRIVIPERDDRKKFFPNVFTLLSVRTASAYVVRPQTTQKTERHTTQLF